MEVLKEVEKTGKAGVPFLNELLTEPSFQKDFAPDGWIGFGAQERAAVIKSLALIEAQDALGPQKKLAQLQIVFDLPAYDCRAGFGPVEMVQEYLDRGLAAVTSVDPAQARPFLKKLLDLPQFQEGFSPIGQTSKGHEWRTQIEAALASLP
jgi:hypothetical protein